MRGAVYNSGIPNVILNSVNRTLRARARASARCAALFRSPRAGDRCSRHRLERAGAATGAEDCGGNRAGRRRADGGEPFLPGKRENEIIQNGLRAALEGLGLRFVKAEQAAATVAISLSENPASYVWVAEIRQGAGEAAVVMVSTPRPQGAAAIPRFCATEPAQDLRCGRRTIRFSTLRCWKKMRRPRTSRCSMRKEFALPDAGRKVAAGADAEHRPRAAMAAGFARKADSGERSFAGCVSSRRDLPQHRGSAVDVELPRE